MVIDDSENDTWGHDRFVFDQVIVEFGDPKFEIRENGPCEVSLKVTTSYRDSRLFQTYTLYPDDPRIHVSVRLRLNEKLVQVKLLFDSGIRDAELIREVPGGLVNCETHGREEPMQRFMIAAKDGAGLAVLNDCKYSASIKDGVLAFIAARSCGYADHRGVQNDRHEYSMEHLDIGVQKFRYDIMPYSGDLPAVFRAAEELNAEFITIHETYHNGPLPQSASKVGQLSDNVTVSALKPAEDGRGVIVRLSEIAGKEADVTATILGTEIAAHVKPFDILSYRIFEGSAQRVDFTEKAK